MGRRENGSEVGRRGTLECGGTIEGIDARVRSLIGPRLTVFRDCEELLLIKLALGQGPCRGDCVKKAQSCDEVLWDRPVVARSTGASPRKLKRGCQAEIKETII